MDKLSKFIEVYWDIINHNIITYNNAGIYMDEHGNYGLYTSDELAELTITHYER